MGDGADGFIDPVSQRAEALSAARSLEAGICMVKQSQLFSLEVAHFAPGAVLPVTHVNLSQSGVQVERKTFGKIYSPCGELGADTTLTERFLKMGVREFSVAPHKVLEVREKVRSICLPQA